MRELITLGLTIGLLVPGAAFAQSAFNGTWSLVPASLHLARSKPMILSLKDGVFAGTQDGTPIKLPADGQDHVVKGIDGVDTVAIRVINDRSFKEIDKENGKIVVTALVTAAADAKTLIVDLKKFDGSYSEQVSRRITAVTPDSNAVSGSWQFDHLSTASGGEYNITYKVAGHTVASSNPEGSFTATIGGKPVAYLNSGMKDITVSADMPGKNVLRETYYSNGKEVSTSTFTIQPGGHTMKDVSGGAKGRPSVVSYRKQ